MNAIASYLAMGGYAQYVWPSYGICAVVLGGLLVVSLIGLKRREAELKLLEETVATPRRRRARSAQSPSGGASSGGAGQGEVGNEA